MNTQIDNDQVAKTNKINTQNINRVDFVHYM